MRFARQRDFLLPKSQGGGTHFSGAQSDLQPDNEAKFFWPPEHPVSALTTGFCAVKGFSIQFSAGRRSRKLKNRPPRDWGSIIGQTALIMGKPWFWRFSYYKRPVDGLFPEGFLEKAVQRVPLIGSHRGGYQWEPFNGCSWGAFPRGVLNESRSTASNNWFRGANPQGDYWQILENGPSHRDFPAVNYQFLPLLVEKRGFQLAKNAFFGPFWPPKLAHCLVLEPFSGVKKRPFRAVFSGQGSNLTPIGGSKRPFFK